jgi:hypothetical protein
MAVVLDSYGTIWGTDTADVTEALITEERAAGTAIDEWETTDRDGQPMRIVRLADPSFLDTVCVFTSGGSNTAVSA